MRYRTALIISAIIGASAPLIFHGIFLFWSNLDIDPSGFAAMTFLSLNILLSPVAIPLNMALGYGTSDIWNALAIWTIAMLLNGGFYALIGSVIWRALAKSDEGNTP